MIESWREFLYPLGFLSNLFFASRFLLQWLYSEIKQESLVTATFWRLSLLGNLLLFIHSFIQVQYHVCLIQSCNAIISWRNLNLMKDLAYQVTRHRVIQMLIFACFFTTFAFVIQDYFIANGNLDWFRQPINPLFQIKSSVSPIWHSIGFLGMILFSSRFWVQWWFAEKYRVSYLGRSFWWLSLIGDLLSLNYFLRILDPVNFIGPFLGLIPYVRNLMLIKKQQNSINPIS